MIFWESIQHISGAPPAVELGDLPSRISAIEPVNLAPLSVMKISVGLGSPVRNRSMERTNWLFNGTSGSVEKYSIMSGRGENRVEAASMLPPSSQKPTSLTGSPNRKAHPATCNIPTRE